ncbi:hypothetical protein MUP38_01375 [Candidatus Bathyarchaeota archaeon]|nr:hypothetical protein [Candidatus Bathyarchaeota archaeon]
MSPEYRNCRKCGAVLDGLRVCKQCGYKLRGPKPKQEVTQTPDLEYTPELLAKKSEIVRPSNDSIVTQSISAIATITIIVDYSNKAQVEALRKFLDDLF